MLRSLLPRDFWNDCRAFRHYARMIVHWQESLAACLLSNRLHEQRWQKRITIHGTPPHQLPEWGERPVIVAYLHTGSFVFLGYWLRASGLHVASFVKVRPPVLALNAELNQRDGQGASLPRTIRGQGALRSTARFLMPGRILTVALDGHFSSGVYSMGRNIRLNDGAVRLALLCNALVLPASVRNKGWFRFEIRFGRPVPQKIMGAGNVREAVQHLASELWEELRQDRCAINWTTLEAYAGSRHRRLAWP